MKKRLTEKILFNLFILGIIILLISNYIGATLAGLFLSAPTWLPNVILIIFLICLYFIIYIIEKIKEKFNK